MALAEISDTCLQQDLQITDRTSYIKTMIWYLQLAERHRLHQTPSSKAADRESKITVEIQVCKNKAGPKNLDLKSPIICSLGSAATDAKLHIHIPNNVKRHDGNINL